MSRPRAAAVVIRTGAKQTEVLMVQHHLDGRRWWTLPGGGVESGESYAAAAVRELREETGLEGVARRCLYARDDHGNPEEGWLADDVQIALVIAALPGFSDRCGGS